MAWQPSIITKAVHTPSNKGVARAQAKHKIDHVFKPESPSLADRFDALPTELSAHVFSFLLVQPVKWDITHQQHCPLRKSNNDIAPAPPGVHWSEPATCASCNGPQTGRWRRDVTLGLNIWTSPWRSAWAPEQQNPFVCTTCYDDQLRKCPIPEAKSLPCLCARRQELQVFLVCKKWYLEAAAVFYTQNTFAFEDPNTFTAFITNLNPRWCDKISKVSLMALNPSDPGDTNVDSGNADPEAQFRAKDWAPVWPLLRSLASLSTLEIDSKLLETPKTARALLKLNLQIDLRRIVFVQRLDHNEELWKHGTEQIWPSIAGRRLMVGGFASEVGRAIKEKRRMLLKIKQDQWEITTPENSYKSSKQDVFESSQFEGLGLLDVEVKELAVKDEDELEIQGLECMTVEAEDLQ